MNREFSQSIAHDAMPGIDLMNHADATLWRAAADGALQPIRTSVAWIDAHGLRFPVRWVDTLARKPRHVLPGQAGNPFLHPEPALVVGPAGPDHVVLLNKYPVVERHLLFVTRSVVPQASPLGQSDLAAIAPLLAAHGGLVFYNAGELAGASQAHRHLQWIPRDNDWLPLLAPIEQAAAGRTPRCPQLPFEHALAALPDGTRATDRLHATYLDLCRALGIDTSAAATAPYNLLITRGAMLLVPRERECCEEISINALGFAGSFFVARPELIGSIRRRGPLDILAAVARR